MNPDRPHGLENLHPVAHNGSMSFAARVHSLFFLSGASALIYEIVWIRRLGLTLGHTVLAISTVVTVFMLGLALGGLYGGRWADRLELERLPRDYARLELAIGLWGGLSLFFLEIFERGYLRLAASEVSGIPLYLCGFLGALVVLLPPTVAMGATLPLLSRLVIGGRDQLGASLAALYGVNTLGGCFGAAAAGFVLLPWLGLRMTLGLAAFLNFAIALLAYRIVVVESEHAAEAPSSTYVPRSGYLVVACLAAVAAMACQVGWTRGLVLSLGSSTYAFSAILTLFLVGLGTGSLGYRLLIGRPDAVRMGWLQFAIGAAISLTTLAMGYFPYLVVRITSIVDGSFLTTTLARLVPVAVLLFVPTFLMGIVYPLATHLYVGGQGRVAQTVGTVYAATTLGSILGAFGSGFLGIPLLGAQGVLKLAAGVSFALAFGCFFSGKGAAQIRCILVLVVGLAGAFMPNWNAALMSAGNGVYASSRNLNLNESGQYFPPSFYKDGLSATVAVHLGPGWQTVRVNGKIDASLTLFDRLTQYLTGYLPGLFHREPKDALVIGFGCGMTVEALSHFPSTRHIDCVELEGAMLEAGTYWKGYNGDILANPKVRAAVNDGRTFLLATPRKYDVICNEPSNPWIAGVANLFTDDFYRHCSDRLNEGGVMCQWFQLYGMSEESVATVFRTFFSVFPQGAVWRSANGDMILLGSNSPLTVDLAELERRWMAAPQLRETMLELRLYDAECLLGHYWLEREDALKFAGSGPLNTDDLPLLEFRAPLTLFDRGTVEAIEKALDSYRSRLLPVETTPALLEKAGMGWLNTKRTDLMEKYLKQSAPLVWGQFYGEEGKAEQALQSYEKAQEAPGSWVADYWLANSQAQNQDYDGAFINYQKALEEAPEVFLPTVLLSQADSAIAAGRPELALASSTEAMLQGSDGYLPVLLRGRALYKMGRFEEALHEFELGSQLNPADLGMQLGRAHTRFQLGQDPTEVYEETLQLAPGFLQPYLELARYHAIEGRPDLALTVVARAWKYFPDDPALVEARNEIENGSLTRDSMFR